MMNNEANPVQLAFEAYAAAVYAKDLDAFVAIYDENVHVFDAWGQWQYSGIAQWRDMAAGWFSSLGDERVEVSYDDVVTSVGDTSAWGHAAVTFAAIAADGSRLRSLRNRFTVALSLSDGVWKIAHEHSSLPIDFETGQVAAVA